MSFPLLPPLLHTCPQDQWKIFKKVILDEKFIYPYSSHITQPVHIQSHSLIQLLPPFWPACMGAHTFFVFFREVPSLHRNMTVFLHLFIFELPNHKGNQKECFQFWIHSWQSLGIEPKTSVCALQLFDIFPWPWKDMLMGSLLLDYYFNFGFIIDCFYFMYSYFRVLL